jgi:integrase
MKSKTVKTKIQEKNGKFYLLVLDIDTGKYKTEDTYPTRFKAEVKREELRDSAIKAKAALNKKNFIDGYKEFAMAKIAIANNSQNGLRAKSVKVYPQHYKKWISPYFSKDVMLNEVTAPVVDAFFLKIRAAGATWKTSNNVVKTFLTCLKWHLENENITEVGPMLVYKAIDRVALKPKANEHRRRITTMISKQEVKELLNLLAPKNADTHSWLRFTVVAVFVFTGMRMSELRALRWDRLDLVTQKFKVDKSIVGSDMRNDVKAAGSERTPILHPLLVEVLIRWKVIHTKYFTPQKIPLVFPSLRNCGSVVPIADRTVNDWLKIAYAKLGFAKIEIIKNKYGDSKAFVKVLWSKFQGCPSKTFRHFASTALLDAQAANPELDDNFIKGFIGHQKITTTREIYGDHSNLDTSSEKDKARQQALVKAFDVTIEGGLND